MPVASKVDLWDWSLCLNFQNLNKCNKTLVKWINYLLFIHCLRVSEASFCLVNFILRFWTPRLRLFNKKDCLYIKCKKSFLYIKNPDDGQNGLNVTSCELVVDDWSNYSRIQKSEKLSYIFVYMYLVDCFKVHFLKIISWSLIITIWWLAIIRQLNHYNTY